MLNKLGQIMVVDDQPAICYSLKRFLAAEGYEVATASGGHDALQMLSSVNPDVVLLDVSMPKMDGLEVLRKIKEAAPTIQVIMMTAFSSTEKAIEATKEGAYEFLLKPLENDRLLKLIVAATENRNLQKEVFFFEGPEGAEYESTIIGQSLAMQNLYRKVGQVAPSKAPVLLLGETGTGKEMFARAICKHSDRKNQPFMAINCAAIPETLLESELFGHEKGAFTGATTRRLGKFEQCHMGTLFLDEIGDMPLSPQSKLLRVLQDGSFQRVGGSEPLSCDVRIIAATNQSLEDMITTRTFREDLYYRINVVTLQIPPLRDRGDDIFELIQYFVHKYNHLLGREIHGVANDVLQKLRNYSWPGNVRELENIIYRAMVLSTGENLTIDCNDQIGIGRSNGSCVSCETAINGFADQILRSGDSCRLPEIISAFETQMVSRALELTNGNQAQAARFLGISRNTLRKKMNEMNRHQQSRPSQPI